MIPDIKYNITVDFIQSIPRVINTNEWPDYAKRFRLNQDIARYIDYVKGSMDPILKRDMEYYCGKFCKGLFAIIFYAIDENINDVNVLLDNIDKMSGEDFVRTIIEKLEIEIPQGVSEEDLQKHIEESLRNDIQDLDNVSIYLDYFKYPNEMKDRLVITLREYYNRFFVSIEQDVKDFMEKKLHEHRILIKDDYDKFFDTIVMLIDKDVVVDKEVEFYICYFNEIGCGLRYTQDGVYTITYGYGLEQKYDDSMKKMEYRELIKLLNDDNRFEIIDLLGKRSWYSKELADHLGITTATMSYHIKKMSTLGIFDIETGKNKRLYYRLNKNKFIKIINNMLFDIIDVEE
jgi:DNA-binding transcriptional ArsR family regulator